jgi:hypothetical protein
MQTPAEPNAPARDELRPLASYVLRVRGRPATLHYELIDLRSGLRHVFRRAESVTAFLQKNGLSADDAAAAHG